MGVQVTPHPAWVADLDRALEPIQQTILNTPVVEDAAENCLAPAKIQNFLVAFYPIIRDFPQWLQLLLDRSPDDGRAFFEDNIRVERRHDAMWRAMGDGFDVPRERFVRREPMLPQVRTNHRFLTDMCRSEPFGVAVAATNYAGEGMAQRISEKGRCGLGKKEQIGPKGGGGAGGKPQDDDQHPGAGLGDVQGRIPPGRAAGP